MLAVASDCSTNYLFCWRNVSKTSFDPFLLFTQNRVCNCRMSHKSEADAGLALRDPQPAALPPQFHPSSNSAPLSHAPLVSPLQTRLQRPPSLLPVTSHVPMGLSSARPMAAAPNTARSDRDSLMSSTQSPLSASMAIFCVLTDALLRRTRSVEYGQNA